ncbi:MAG: response regulator [Deltaproteobacteria bacterium]|nr:response regulator [Deltaproteobacteria bacterium]
MNQDRPVLIIDDDPDFSEALGELLEPQGYTITVAHTLIAGRDAARRTHPEVALVDVKIGNDRGTDLIPLLKEDHPNLLCVVMTAYTDADTVIEALKKGADDYLRKPLDPVSIRTTLNRCFDIARLKREREQAREQLELSEERYRDLVEASLQGVLIHRAYKPLFINNTLAQIFGYDTAKTMLSLDSVETLFEVGKLAPKETPPTASSTDENPLRKRIQTTRAHRKDGGILWLECHTQPVMWDGESAEQMVVLDVTERVRLEDQLRQSQKMDAVGYLAGGVAHDFNNILQIIRGYAELATFKAKSEPKVVEPLTKLMQAAEKGGDLTRQLLAFSRKEVLRIKPVDPNALITNLMKMVQRLIGEDIELELETSAKVPPMLADPGMIEQVILNLCVNARDAMPNGGTLFIRVEEMVPDDAYRRYHPWAKRPAYAKIMVSDTGIGMKPEVLERIFEPFFTTKAVGKGTGLGLSVAYGIVEQHHGYISVYSEEGIGTTFSLFVPCSDQVREIQAAEVEQKEIPGGKETILVAEDEPPLLDLLVSLLESKGYQIIRASNGEEAVARFEEFKEKIDLVILDVIMPKMRGHQALLRMKELRKDLPVVFSTGYAGNALSPEFLAEHDARMIHKPYSPAMLFRTVREALDKLNPS